MAIKRSHTHGASVLLLQLLFIFHCLTSHDAEAANSSFTRGGGLRDWETLVSPNKVFTLGFRPLGESNSRYLGIWYDTGFDRAYTFVWIANRDTPIGNSTGFLTIDDADGNLKIMHSGGDGRIPLSSERAANGSVVTASLLNSGNFVLNETYSNGAGYRILWESFDYPTDILLPGMKLGVNSKTGKNWSLTSWFSNQLPDSGAFTLEVDPNGTNQLVISRRGEVYWRSGVWNGNNFENLPELTPIEENSPFANQYNYSFVSSKDERYFTYSAKPGSDYSSAILVWMLRSMGQLWKMEVVGPASILGPEKLIDCGNKMKGCEGNKPSACRSGEEVFELRNGDMSGVPLNNFETVFGNTSLSDCEIKCRSNCSCSAYASYNNDGRGCRLWDKGSKFIENSNTKRDIYLMPSKQEKSWWKWLIIALAIAIVMTLLASLSYLRWKRLKETEANEDEELLELGALSSGKFGEENLHEKHGKKTNELILFKFDSIMAATDNFSSTNKLGEGGFGPVYKGNLLEGHEIAVKRLSRNSGQGLKEFKNELVLIAKLQHRNLVRLLGCCVKGEERMLIYEYMPNKSLDSFLFDPVGRELLDWKKRINIIEGIAQGLLYLHTYSRLRVIHRDLKASNILLDDEMNPKISDFGMARIFGLRESEANTNRIVGTYGYMSPEYAMEGTFSEKSDVFSFGVLLLEIVSGKKNNTHFSTFERNLNLIGYAWELWEKGAGIELMDPMMNNTSPKDKMLRCIQVGLLCVQESATDRPTMLDVVSMFANEAMPSPVPKQPAFYGGQSVVGADLLKDESESCSLNGLTMSVMEA